MLLYTVYRLLLPRCHTERYVPLNNSITVLFFSAAGKSFGEIALISEDSVRNASIIADEETDLLVINRELFNSTLKVGHVKCEISTSTGIWYRQPL